MALPKVGDRVRLKPTCACCADQNGMIAKISAITRTPRGPLFYLKLDGFDARHYSIDEFDVIHRLYIKIGGYAKI